MKIPYAKHALPKFTADAVFGRGEFDGEGLEQELDGDYHEVARNNPRGAGGRGQHALDEAVRCFSVGEFKLMRRCLSIAMEGGAASSRAYAAGLGIDVDFVFDGQTYRGPAKQYGMETHPDAFVRTFSFAIALRHNEAQLALSAMTSEIERKTGGGMDEGFFLFSEAYRHFWRQDPDTKVLLEDAATHLEPAQLRVADPRAVAPYSSCIPAMVAILDNDEVAFNQSLFEGVKAHKAWWGRGERLKDPDGFWAALPLALAVMAHDRGMPVRVESDYIPRWFIEGTDPE